MASALWRALRSRDGLYSSPVRRDPERAALFKREAEIERAADKIEELLARGLLTVENIQRLRRAVETVAAQPTHAWPEPYRTELAEVRAAVEGRSTHPTRASA